MKNTLVVINFCINVDIIIYFKFKFDNKLI